MNQVTISSVRHDAVSERQRVSAFSAMARAAAEERGRADSAEFGSAFARSLEYTYGEILRQRRAPQNAFAHYPMVSRVPVGARRHTVTMAQGRGRPTFYRNGTTDVPLADADGRQESFNIADAVLGFHYDLFEEESERFARSQQPTAIPVIREKQAATIMGHEQFVNDVTYAGDTNVNLYGILNFPWTPRRTLAAAWGGATAQAKEDLLAALNRLFNSPSELSKQTFMPDTCEMPLGLYNFLASTRNSDSSDLTMLQVLLRNQPYIRNIWPAHELDGAGPDGEDVIVCYRRSEEAVCFEVSRMAQMFPGERKNMGLLIPHVTTMGGVIQRFPLSNVIGYIDRA